MKNDRFQCGVEVVFPGGKPESFDSLAAASLYLCKPPQWLAWQVINYRRRTLDAWPEELVLPGFIVRLDWTNRPLASHRVSLASRVAGRSLVAAEKSWTGRL